MFASDSDAEAHVRAAERVRAVREELDRQDGAGHVRIGSIAAERRDQFVPPASTGDDDQQRQ